MRRVKSMAAVCALATLLAAPGVQADDAAEQSAGAIELAKMLEGRVAAEPQSCIRILPSTDVTVIDGTALVYKVGRTLYVNIPKNAASVDDDDTLVRRTSLASQLCNTDIITTIDRFHGGYTGNIILGQFVPYRKAAR